MSTQKLNTLFNTDLDTEQKTLKAAQEGKAYAIEQIIKDHQNFIYNIALKMMAHNQDAEDATQEILLKVITNLGTFKGKSKLSTWIYRIVVNHVLNVKKSKSEKVVTTFSAYGDDLDSAPEFDIADDEAWPEKNILVEEAKLSCMTGMLLCLTREQRIVFVLGEIFVITDRVGSEVLNISRDGFRQKLARVRRQLYDFMNNKCGLINKNNPCRCSKKTAAFIKIGFVDPMNLQFQSSYIHKIQDKVGTDPTPLKKQIEYGYQVLYRDHPYKLPPNYSKIVQNLIESDAFKSTFDF